jgi:hypothetical protein
MTREYKLNTIKEIIDILDYENIDNFLIDFNNFIRFKVSLKELKEIKIETTDDCFNWIDDGKNDVNINIIMK